MRPLLRLSGRLAAAFEAVAMLGLAALVAVVAGSIALRLIFDVTGGAINLLLPGAIELSGLCLLVTVTAALPGAAARGLTRVDLLLGALPAGLARALSALWSVLLAGIAGLLVTLLVSRAMREAAGGHLSQDLGLPLWPFTAFAAAAAAALALVALTRVLERQA